MQEDNFFAFFSLTPFKAELWGAGVWSCYHEMLMTEDRKNGESLGP